MTKNKFIEVNEITGFTSYLKTVRLSLLYKRAVKILNFVNYR